MMHSSLVSRCFKDVSGKPTICGHPPTTTLRKRSTAMTTTSPEPSPYAVRLDADDKHGILPHAESPDPVQQYEQYREFIAWLLSNSQSQASLPLRVRAGKFYEKLEAAQTSASDVPSYDEYLDLVDAYNTERGYDSPLRSEEASPTAGLEAKLDKVIALLEKDPPASQQQSRFQKARDKVAAVKAAASSNAQPTHPAPSSQSPSGSTRSRH